MDSSKRMPNLIISRKKVVLVKKKRKIISIQHRFLSHYTIHMKNSIAMLLILTTVLLGGCGIRNQTTDISVQTGDLQITGASGMTIALGEHPESISLSLTKWWEGKTISWTVTNALDASQAFQLPMSFIVTNTTTNQLLLTTPEFVEEDEISRNVYAAPSFEVTCNGSRENPVAYVPWEIATAENRNDGQGPRPKLTLSSRTPQSIMSGGSMTLIDGNSPFIVFDANQTAVQGTTSITCKLRVNRFAGVKEAAGIQQGTQAYYSYLDLDEKNPSNAWIMVDQATISLWYTAQKLTCEDTSCNRSVSFREQ